MLAVKDKPACGFKKKVNLGVQGVVCNYLTVRTGLSSFSKDSQDPHLTPHFFLVSQTQVQLLLTLCDEATVILILKPGLQLLTRPPNGQY